MEPSCDLRVDGYTHDSEYEKHSGSHLAHVSPLYESPKPMAGLL